MRKTRELPPLLVRADADGAQGMGHVIRSLALARAWHERGGEIYYLTSHPATSLRRRIELAGADVIEIGQAYPANGDLKTTRALIERLQRDGEANPWLVLDGYHFVTEYQSAIRRTGCRILVIDDNAHLARYDSDILLNHGLHAPALEYRDSGDAWLLLGTRYGLLRPEFEPWRGRERIIPKQAKNILVTLGGADTNNVTTRVLNALSLLGDLALETRVLAGPLNSRLAELGRITATMPNVELCIDVTDPAPLMAWADIAVAAAGTTAWELAFMQAPAILLVLAANQVPVAGGLDAFGAAQSLGSSDGLTSGAIAAALRHLIHDAPQRRRMADRAKILVDGMGPARLLAAMRQREKPLLDSELTIRHASLDDALLLWQWANDPVTRRNSFNGGSISWDEHQAWCARKHASADCRLWIMRAGELPVGQIRYERRRGDAAELSFSVAPGFRGNGLGTRLLQSTFDLAARELGVCQIEGAALVQNAASRRAFLNAGFVASEEKVISGKACVVFRRLCAVPAQKNDHVSYH
jgi:UDP-2,4-diacetamido-2,4,6-trideoxy-beta-L-altropyranose hydrolase